MERARSAGIRVVTYNVHKCRGLDRRVRPARIADVLREIHADIIALQEVVCIEGKTPQEHQARYIADELGLEYRLGETRRHRGGAYGNVVLTRLPMFSTRNYDLSQPGREERGCLHVDIELRRGLVLHFYNIHLGTAYLERRKQARKLLDEDILKGSGGIRIVLGDFNEWTRGLTTKLLSRHFECVDARLHLGRSRTYPGVMPFLHLDHIYFDRVLKLKGATLHRSRTALIASDHLPIVADFRIENH
ncbi:MAG TPA: endonuclease/exonuclease/phosphatase family protein [Syntrophorhabdales bacterium]|nr:endonuclease/exonuclease/phosphatase family protein [Syntrophorhabdales bacterium]